MGGFHSCLTLKICIGNMIRRIKEYAKREPSRDAHKIYIVCEGKGTEPYYFSFFEGPHPICKSLRFHQVMGLIR